LMLFNNLLSCH